MSTTWLLTGGAGYIGAHIAEALLASGRGVVVLDDMSTGIRANVPEDVTLVEANLLDTAAVRNALIDHEVSGVVHLAGKKAVGESVDRPLWYYEQNLTGTQSVLSAMVDTGVTRLVFSSSASTYGTQPTEMVTEDVIARPESPYGETKLVSEWIIRHVCNANGLAAIALRYFNVVGAARPPLGDRGVFNLVPLALRALSNGEAPQIYGDDYPTRDGTCIRDYIHAIDLASAHVAAVKALDAGRTGFDVMNVGRGQGVTVREVLQSVRAVTGIDVDPVVVGRRAGDPAAVVASADRISRELDWRAVYDLSSMVTSAWEAWQVIPATS